MAVCQSACGSAGITANTQIAATAIPYPLENQTKFKPEQSTNKTK